MIILLEREYWRSMKREFFGMEPAESMDFVIQTGQGRNQVKVDDSDERGVARPRVRLAGFTRLRLSKWSQYLYPVKDSLSYSDSVHMLKCSADCNCGDCIACLCFQPGCKSLTNAPSFGCISSTTP